MPNPTRSNSASPEEPVFIVGTHYSGARLLALALSMHPNLVIGGPTDWLPDVVRQIGPTLDRAKASWANTGLASVSGSGDRFYEVFGQALASMVAPPGRGERLRWIDCSPSASRSLMGLLRIFPNAKVLHLAQEIDIVMRALARWPVPGDPAASKSAAGYWSKTETYLAECQIALGSDVMLTIPSRSLYRNLGETLEDCLRFIGEDRGCMPASAFKLDGDLQPVPPDCHIDLESAIVPPEAEVLSALLSHAMLPFERNERVLARLQSAFEAQPAPAQSSKAVAVAEPASKPVPAPPRPAPKGTVGAKELVTGIREFARRQLPRESRVMVMTKGDDDLLMLECAGASHFPQQEDGRYAGFYPANSEDAIKGFEAVRRKGHDYFILPSPYFWWLSHYADFASHLRNQYTVTYYDEKLCMVFDLARKPESQTALLPSVPVPAPKPVQSPSNGVAPTGNEVVALSAVTATQPSRPKMPTRMIATKLWSGYSTYALADLNDLLKSEATDKADKLVAAWELARWHTVECDYEEALRFLERLYEIAPEERLRKRNLLLEIDLNLRLGRHHAAKQLAAWAVERYGFDTDLMLAAANAFDSDGPAGMGDRAARLEVLNLIFDSHGLMPLRKIDREQPLSLDNIEGACDSDVTSGGSIVTVIMPARNAAKTIGFALGSLLRQTWRDLEIIVVDDASTDDTASIVAELQSSDGRIKLIRQCENRGPYLARNAALPHVTGEYVTVHDADDWSHPQKIERQMEALEASGEVALTSSWVRVSPELRSNGTWRPGDLLISENLSSLIMSAETLRTLGGWDAVKVNADDEFRRRLEAKFRTKVGRALDGIPLAFALDDSASLTRDSRTHVRTEFFGIRRDYRLAFERWHARAAEADDFYLDTAPGSRRRFPAPRLMLLDAPSHSYDVVFACNYALTGGAFISAYTYLLAALRANLRAGVLDWRRYDNDLNRPADQRLLDLIDEGRVEAISAGDDVETRHLVFCHPPILEHKPDRLPNIKADHVFVTVNQMAERLETGTDVAYEPESVKANLISMFGHTGSWFGISPGVRQKMCNDSRYPEPGDVIWTELLDTEAWQREPLWRGRERETPVVGRHGRDHYTKWPSTARDIADAYCVDTGWSVQFLGGAAEAVKVLGYTPENWTTYPFDSLDVRAFLDNLDFLVHFPHEDYIEEYGRVVMEAMALGIPVLMPHKFASTFGAAGIYCYPREVSRVIQDLWQDEPHYLERGRMGLRYVQENCSYDQLLYRLDRPIQLKAEVGRNGN